MFLSYESEIPADAIDGELAERLVEEGPELISDWIGLVINPTVYSTEVFVNGSVVHLITSVNDNEVVRIRTFMLWLVGFACVIAAFGLLGEVSISRIIRSVLEVFLISLASFCFVGLLNGFGWIMHKRAEARLRHLLTRVTYE